MSQLMREMTSKLDTIKVKMESNIIIDQNQLNFPLIHTKNVTDSSFVQTHIKPMSIAFDYSVKEFNINPTRSNYNAIINNCKNCHHLSCQGPLMKINKLILKEKKSFKNL